MSTLANVSLPLPKDWQSFERSTRQLFRYELRDPNTQMHGRTGQPQHGVDVYGHRNEDPARLVGVQCKLSADEISEGELRAELEKAKNFEPPITEFILVTTAPRDGKIQEVARKLTAELANSDRPMRVNVWGWQDVEENAANYDEAWKAFDPTWNPFAAQAHEKQLGTLQALQAQLTALGKPWAEPLDVATALAHVLACANADLTAFKRMPTWPKVAVSLDLRATFNDTTAVIDAADLSGLLAEHGEAELIAPPGMGKTTTMLQVTEALIVNAQSPAFFIPLDEWATDS